MAGAAFSPGRTGELQLTAALHLRPSLPRSANCPVFGRPDAAAGGTLVAVPAGAPAARERLAPLLQAFSGGRLGLLECYLAACFLRACFLGRTTSPTGASSYALALLYHNLTCRAWRVGPG